MPRSKPDQVVTHRIEMGGWERERIKEAELVAAATLLLPAIGIAAAGLASAGAAYALYQWLKDGPFVPLMESLVDEKGVSKLWGEKNPLLQVIPNLGWLRGSEYSAWW